MIADFHDTLVLLSIEVQDDNHQTVPGASVFLENYDNMGTPLPISNEPPPPPVTTTTTTNPGQTTTTTVPGTETATTSTTSVFPVATTTTSAPPGGCDLDAPTFASIGCRLDGLLVRIAGETSLGDYRQKLPPLLAAAAARLDEAARSCGAGDAKRASKKIKQAAHRLVQYAHGMNGRRAHRRLPAALREELVTRGNDIRAAVTILRKTVHCPEDAPARSK